MFLNRSNQLVFVNQQKFFAWNTKIDLIKLIWFILMGEFITSIYKVKQCTQIHFTYKFIIAPKCLCAKTAVP